jgi:hypothetical protein
MAESLVPSSGFRFTTASVQNPPPSPYDEPARQYALRRAYEKTRDALIEVFSGVNRRRNPKLHIPSYEECVRFSQDTNGGSIGQSLLIPATGVEESSLQDMNTFVNNVNIQGMDIIEVADAKSVKKLIKLPFDSIIGSAAYHAASPSAPPSTATSSGNGRTLGRFIQRIVVLLLRALIAFGVLYLAYLFVTGHPRKKLETLYQLYPPLRPLVERIAVELFGVSNATRPVVPDGDG